MPRIPMVETLVAHGIVMDKPDARKLRKALIRGDLKEAAEIMESLGCTTKDIKGRKFGGHVYQVDFFLTSDAETLLSIDGRSWFVGDPAVTFAHLERHG